MKVFTEKRFQNISSSSMRKRVHVDGKAKPKDLSESEPTVRHGASEALIKAALEKWDGTGRQMCWIISCQRHESTIPA